MARLLSSQPYHGLLDVGQASGSCQPDGATHLHAREMPALSATLFCCRAA